jgi:hypothetical protein
VTEAGTRAEDEIDGGFKGQGQKITDIFNTTPSVRKTVIR